MPDNERRGDYIDLRDMLIAHGKELNAQTVALALLGQGQETQIGQLKKINGTLDDHGKRLRLLEGWRSMLVGAWTASIAGLGVWKMWGGK